MGDRPFDDKSSDTLVVGPWRRALDGEFDSPPSPPHSFRSPALDGRRPQARDAPARRADLLGKLIYSMSVSLDGFVDTPSHSLDWVQVDEELHSWFNDEASAMSAFLYGRRMYELMADYWPKGEDDPAATPAMRDFSRIWKPKPKVVFSRTLDEVGWNGRLVRGDAGEEVARLKARPGFDMDVGGPTIASTLIRRGLVDEYRLFVQPVILGTGTPFFPPLNDRIGLKLVETRTFGSGVVYLRYETVAGAG